MNAARAAALALIACAGVAIPATTAHADDPLLCGLLAPCDGEVIHRRIPVGERS